MQIRDAEKLLKQIQSKYNANPEGNWRILMGRDSSGRPTQLIGSSRKSWQIKGEMIKPNKFAGVGLELEGLTGDDLLGFDNPYYGLRPLDLKAIKSILRGGAEKGLEELIRMPPAPLEAALSAEALIEGPIMHSRSPITSLSRKQEELEKSLDRSLEKMIRKRYPETRYAYS